MHINDDFSAPRLSPEFRWLNEPSFWRTGAGLELRTERETDFWQGTHYGFRRTNGHALLAAITGSFVAETTVEFEPAAQYDQCGLFAWVGEANWIKAGIELENAGLSRLGAVVTNAGWSDWSTQDIPSSLRRASYRLHRAGQDFLVEFSADGRVWTQIRLAHLAAAPESMEVGLFACSPKGADMPCRFARLSIGPAAWPASH